MRAGYRAPFFRSLSRAVADGNLDPESWNDPSISNDDLRERILAVPGAGPYVADNLMRLLGRYDRLGLDTWCRGKLRSLWRRRTLSDAAIERAYAAHGRFRGLVLWCDLTRDWFEGDALTSWLTEFVGTGSISPPPARVI